MISFNNLRKYLFTYKSNYRRFVSNLNSFSNNNTINENDFNSTKSLDFNKFKSLAVNKRIEAKIKIILSEYELYKESEENRDRVPNNLSVNHMKQLLNCNECKQRGRLWRDLSANQRKHVLYLMKRLESNDGNNRLTAPLLPFEFEKFYANRLKQSALFGQNIVFDVSFDKYMSTLECKNLAEQLNRIYKINRYESIKYSLNELPFTLNICSLNNNEKTYNFMNFLFPEMFSNQSFINMTSKSYLDLFPKEQLIYLSPHSDNVMTEYDHNSVFIIGGIVDRHSVLSLSYPKAKEQSIRSMRLPIDALTTKCNIQSLDAVFKVLFDFKTFGVNSGTTGLKRIRKHILKHKLKSMEQMEYELNVRQEMEEIFDELESIDEEFNETQG